MRSRTTSSSSSSSPPPPPPPPDCSISRSFLALSSFMISSPHLNDFSAPPRRAQIQNIVQVPFSWEERPGVLKTCGELVDHDDIQPPLPPPPGRRRFFNVSMPPESPRRRNLQVRTTSKVVCTVGTADHGTKFSNLLISQDKRISDINALRGSLCVESHKGEKRITRIREKTSVHCDHGEVMERLHDPFVEALRACTIDPKSPSAPSRKTSNHAYQSPSMDGCSCNTKTTNKKKKKPNISNYQLNKSKQGMVAIRIPHYIGQNKNVKKLKNKSHASRTPVEVGCFSCRSNMKDYMEDGLIEAN